MKKLALLIALFLVSCTSAPPSPEDAPLALEPASFSSLPGWRTDTHSQALEAFKISCTRIMKQNPDKVFGPVGGVYGDWQKPCAQAFHAADARAFFETHFRPWQAAAGSNRKGLFTGYYEPSLKGSLTRHGPYQTPIRARPGDLVMVDLGEFREELKGQRIAGRVNGGHLKPYEDRAAIASGRLPADQDRPLAWVDDPVGAFFLQVQGSGRIILDDGRELRVGYDGQNGHPYYAIGRELIKRGELEKDKVSLQTIRAWLEANPHQAAEIMNTNKSYVFFKVQEGPGPLGGEGLPLTPERSLAVDRAKLPYGIPLWVDIAPPVEGEPPLRRLMVAQDTGGAIVGAVRGDVFWGYGPRAEHLAGHMKSQGGYWLLLPLTTSLPAGG